MGIKVKKIFTWYAWQQQNIREPFWHTAFTEKFSSRNRTRFLVHKSSEWLYSNNFFSEQKKNILHWKYPSTKFLIECIVRIRIISFRQIKKNAPSNFLLIRTHFIQIQGRRNIISVSRNLCFYTALFSI